MFYLNPTETKTYWRCQNETGIRAYVFKTLFHIWTPVELLRIKSGVFSHLSVYTQQFLHVSDSSYGWVHAGDVIGATSTAAETSLYN